MLIALKGSRSNSSHGWPRQADSNTAVSWRHRDACKLNGSSRLLDGNSRWSQVCQKTTWNVDRENRNGLFHYTFTNCYNYLLFILMMVDSFTHSVFCMHISNRDMLCAARLTHISSLFCLIYFIYYLRFLSCTSYL